VKKSNAAKSNLINRTVNLWQSRYGRDLSREDARQIVENVTGFFSVLNEWSRGETHPAANNNSRKRSPVQGA
jgi:hypothetical protein